MLTQIGRYSEIVDGRTCRDVDGVARSSLPDLEKGVFTGYLGVIQV